MQNLGNHLKKDHGERQEESARRPDYQSPTLTEYGTVEDLVDAGVVGSAPSLPSVMSD